MEKNNFLMLNPYTKVIKAGDKGSRIFGLFKLAI